jgi:DNA-binding GntR family transcriptional regulator
MYNDAMPPFDAVPAEAAFPRPRRPRRARAPGALSGWLSARIVERLRELGLEPGAHITEQALADHFQVSRTPVRAALEALAKAGAVAHEANRGYFVAQPPAALDTGGVVAEDEDRLYYRIAEDRLKGRIPQRVTEAQLVRRYRVARKRVAATLTRMAHEGWLQRLPGQGWAFEAMLDSVKGYEDGYRFRAAIEPAALRQPRYRLPAEAIRRLRESQREFLAHNARYTDAQAFDLGSGFHEAIVAASGNAFLLDALRRVNSLRRLFEYRAKRDRASILGQYREHMAMLDLIEAGKLERAAKLMEKHLVGAGKMKARLVSQPKPTTKE